MTESRAERILDAIYDDVHQRLDPDDDGCGNCGGEGYTYDCIDGCCVDAESGCEDCASRCDFCASFELSIRKAVQLDVLRSLDPDLAVAFLKRNNKWSDKITPSAVLANLHAGRVAHKEFSWDEREASACWVEGLL